MKVEFLNFKMVKLKVIKINQNSQMTDLFKFNNLRCQCCRNTSLWSINKWSFHTHILRAWCL